MADLHRLLRPQTIAVIGGQECARVIEQCDKLGFEGTIWPVHPKRETMGGRPCYRAIEELPAVPDAAYVAVNRERSVEVVAQLARIGCGGAICYAAGFAEAQSESAGAQDLQKILVEAANDMPIIGPNCYGLINTLDNIALWPDQHGAVPCKQGVAILTQSSNIAINLTMQARGLPLAYILTAGNQAQLGLSELALAALEDERVTALGLHIEGLDDVHAFENLARRARALNKPIVALKVGQSDLAQQATLTHTASLAGSDAAHNALFKRLGIARVHSLETMLETLKLLHCGGVLGGNTIVSLSCSGGEASLMADTGERTGLHFPPFEAEQQSALKEALGPLITIANPLDYNTFIWGDWPATTQMFTAALSAKADLSILVLDFPRLDRCALDDWDAALEAFCKAVQATKARAAVLATLPETMPEPYAQRLIEHGITPFAGCENALSAVRAAADIGEIWSKLEPLPLAQFSRSENAESRVLNEAEAKQKLAAYGVVVPKSVTFGKGDDLHAVMAGLEFPLVAKALGIAHKSEMDAVHLRLTSFEEVSTALQSMAGLSDEFLIEQMVHTALAELLVGVTQDPVCGPMLTIGAGGVLTELLEDTATMLLPATEADIREAIASLKMGRLLEGYRKSDAADIDALVANILCIAQFALAQGDRLIELDVNPLLATQFGSVAVDALIVEALVERK